MPRLSNYQKTGEFSKKLYIQSEGKLSESSKFIPDKVKYFKLGKEIHDVAFSVLKHIYATVVSINIFYSGYLASSFFVVADFQ